MQQADQLRAGLQSLVLSLDEQQQRLLLDYLGLLGKWNRTFSLTAITAPGEMVSHHLLDSLAALVPLASQQAIRLLDVGSGGGQPGIPFAIARPDWQLVLLDSNQKKTTFLRQAVIELGLRNVEVVCSRVEQYRPVKPFDLITSRAFTDVAGFVDLSRHLLAPSGRWAALKGVAPVTEIAALAAEAGPVATVPLHVPGLDAERCLVLIGPPNEHAVEKV